ncbi:chymotrypsin-2-like [Palaemon carinicauda]|uniref:chymotrypsin-2-like n=1 Tax=Palaemon carinicauda TaxID=392227 RepID=UPI0035B60E5B
MPINTTITSTTLKSTNQMATEITSTGSTTSSCNVTRPYCSECGAFKISVTDSRIVNGSNASVNEFPYQVAVIAHIGNQSGLCGGSIIKRRWVLCAAHCLVIGGVRVDGATVRIGDIDIREARTLIPHNFFVHEKYNGSNYANDIALIELQEDFNFTDPSTQPICIAEESDIPFGGKAVVTGWGQISTDGPISFTLQEVAVDIINNTLCEELFVLPPEGEKAVCAFTPYQGTCHGDSGGPLVTKLCDGRWVIFGVVSYGSIFGCAHPDIPTVFTRVPAHRSWIDKVTGSPTIC